MGGINGHVETPPSPEWLDVGGPQYFIHSSSVIALSCSGLRWIWSRSQEL